MTEICTAEALRAYYAEPSELAVKKELSFIDKHAREFIGRAPFVVVSTCDADGWPDGSPRGDAPGFVGVEGEHRLMLPDRPGNNRVDSWSNLIANPRIALLFVVPKRLETLRINGTGRLLVDEETCRRYAANGKPARAVVEVTAKQVYFQCGKALVRSRMWQPDHWPSIDGLATFAEALTDQIRGVEKATVEQRLEKSYSDTLY